MISLGLAGYGSSSARSHPIKLPTSSWRPGDVSQLAILSGILHGGNGPYERGVRWGPRVDSGEFL